MFTLRIFIRESGKLRSLVQIHHANRAILDSLEIEMDEPTFLSRIDPADRDESAILAEAEEDSAE